MHAFESLYRAVCHTSGDKGGVFVMSDDFAQMVADYRVVSTHDCEG